MSPHIFMHYVDLCTPQHITDKAHLFRASWHLNTTQQNIRVYCQDLQKKTLHLQPSLHQVLLISQRKLLMYQLVEYLAVNAMLFILLLAMLCKYILSFLNFSITAHIKIACGKSQFFFFLLTSINLHSLFAITTKWMKECMLPVILWTQTCEMDTLPPLTSETWNDVVYKTWERNETFVVFTM